MVPDWGAFEAMFRLLQVIGLMWSKELEDRSLSTLHALACEAVCTVEVNLPASERDIKLHTIIDLAQCIKAWGE